MTTKGMETPIRFAPLIRVSTESQERKGESLATQEKQIKQYVELLHGVIPESCWKYKGQEHATPNQERVRLEQLLQDATKNLFDAIIVCDASRWSRDNQRSKAGLAILRENDIRFFVGIMEYDLHNAEHEFMLGMSAEINEMQAKKQQQNSIINRIERAKSGRPTAGALPYGRTWTEKEGWGIDPVKQIIIKEAAERYKKGEPLVQIAETYKMDFSNLWYILTKRCGAEWPLHFKYKRIDETVVMKVPPLLDQQTIDAIHERGRANKTYKHGEIKNNYLLKRMIFCSKCGYALFGSANVRGDRYYKHGSYNKRKCTSHRHVPARIIEPAVLLQLIHTLGDVDKMEKAIKEATPDEARLEAMRKEREELKNDIKNNTLQKNTIIAKIGLRIITDEEAKTNLDKLRERETYINNRLYIIDQELSTKKDPKEIKKLSKMAQKVILNITSNSPEAIFKKPYEWQKKLVEHAFAGRDAEGKRYGVYIEETEDSWNFKIHGAFETTLLALPLSDDYLMDVFNIDPEYQDSEKALEDIKTNLARYLPLQNLLFSVSPRR